MDLSQFEACIEAAILEVPEKIRTKIENVGFVVEEDARQAGLREQGIVFQGTLLGLYQGVPLPRRGVHYNAVLPDKITLFKNTIERIAGPDEASIRRLIHDVVLHEIGHYFGMDEKRVRDWEQKRRSRGHK